MEQNEKLAMLPADILRKVEMEQAKEEKLELKMAKESLWKLRTTERKIEQTKEISEIRKLEKRKETVTKVLETERKKLMEQEQEIRTTKNKNNKNKNKKEENVKKLRKVGEIWTTYRWITEHIQENNEKWEEDLKKFQENEFKQLELWDKLTRKEKIESIMNNKETRENNELPEINNKNLQEQETPTIINTNNITNNKGETSNIEITTEIKAEIEKITDEEGGEGVTGGGAPLGAVLIPNIKLLSESKQEGDPPIGKERGALGVGTGPTPLPSDPPPQNGHNLPPPSTEEGKPEETIQYVDN